MFGLLGKYKNRMDPTETLKDYNRNYIYLQYIVLFKIIL